MILNQELIRRAKVVLANMGSEVKMHRTDEGESIFMKPMDSDSVKLVLSYVQHLEDDIERRKQGDSQVHRMAHRFGVAVTAIDEIKNLQPWNKEGVFGVISKATKDIDSI
jgi:hypothetical protein